MSRRPRNQQSWRCWPSSPSAENSVDDRRKNIGRSAQGARRTADGRSVKIFRKNDDLRQLVEHQRLLRALGTIVGPAQTVEPPTPVEPELAQVVSLAALRARRVGHPSAGGRSDAPVTARN